jgi:hypothetical protein
MSGGSVRWVAESQSLQQPDPLKTLDGTRLASRRNKSSRKLAPEFTAQAVAIVWPAWMLVLLAHREAQRFVRYDPHEING